MSTTSTTKLIISDYTIDTGYEIFFIDATSENVTVTLPLINNLDGINFTLSRIDSSTNTVTLNGNGALINGSSTRLFPLNSNGRIVSLNGNWYVSNGDLIPVFLSTGSDTSYRFFVMTANKTFTNTTTETTLFGSGLGSLILPANFFTVGRTVRIQLRGIISSGLTVVYTTQIKLGSSVVASSTSGSLSVLTSAPLVLNGTLTCQSTGVNGSIMGNFDLNIGALSVNSAEGAPITIDTTVSQTLDVTGQFSLLLAANSVTNTIGLCYAE